MEQKIILKILKDINYITIPNDIIVEKNELNIEYIRGYKNTFYYKDSDIKVKEYKKNHFKQNEINFYGKNKEI